MCGLGLLRTQQCCWLMTALQLPSFVPKCYSILFIVIPCKSLNLNQLESKQWGNFGKKKKVGGPSTLCDRGAGLRALAVAEGRWGRCRPEGSPLLPGGPGITPENFSNFICNILHFVHLCLRV